MLWQHLISRDRFESSFARDDVASSGKWLVPIALDDDETWDVIIKAVHAGRIVGAKISSDILDRQLGHRLVCAYCRTSDEAAVRELLATLRDIGIEGPLSYKSDRATIQNRDDKLWTSERFEASTPTVP